MLFKVTTTASNTDGMAVRECSMHGLLSCAGHRHRAITKRKLQNREVSAYARRRSSCCEQFGARF